MHRYCVTVMASKTQCEYGYTIESINHKSKERCDNTGKCSVSFGPMLNFNLCSWHTFLLLVHYKWPYETCKNFKPERYKE